MITTTTTTADRSEPGRGMPSWAVEDVTYGSKIDVDPRLVEALMRTGLNAYNIPQSDENKDTQGLSDAIWLGNLGRDPNGFYAPEALYKRDSQSRNADKSWRSFADLVLKKAFYRAFG